MFSAQSTLGQSGQDMNGFESFSTYLLNSRRILALLGAGISAPSGLPTFSGAGGQWNGYDTKQLSNPWTFSKDPHLVWQYYAEFKHQALIAHPNSAHFALAELARQREGFLTISQNIDGLCERANHPRHQLHLLHGSVFDVRCTSCEYAKSDNFEDYLPVDATNPQHQPGAQTSLVYLLSLPQCPCCKMAPLRPGVVWYGERLPPETVDAVGQWIDAGPIDLILVIGTRSAGFAAEYVELARGQGARLAVVNIDRNDEPPGGLYDGDWFFVGDAKEIVPEMLKGIIGKCNMP